MKKTLKTLVLSTLLIFSISVLFVGCGKKAIPADQTAKALYNLYVLEDDIEAKNIGLSDEEISSVLDAQKKASKQTTKNNFSAGGLPVTDNQLEEIYKAQIEALKKLTVTTEIVSSDKETTIVKISTTYADIEGADTKAGEDASTEIENNNISSLSKASEIYIAKMIENFKNIAPSTETRENTFEFKKEKLKVDGKVKEIWVPKDMEAFGTTLGTMITGK